MEPSQNALSEHEVNLDAQFFPLISVSVFVPGHAVWIAIVP